ncbi:MULTISPECIES: hypothetical protein [Hymenobacter]|uniref:Uncharacterized protein n=1 Tax=Hymenobacter jejuensis TaxID=2502781 RepID=A0A5B8A0P8_9BACT|nr:MULTISPECIES: hypothetical protein [Hymenobacter]MBC6991935.1 hypothetical protein [Hymenobacter sp. BT491]QDA60255.1 hypothetical protein FHG12_09075 [Hymenobacter jejuensis]
MKRLIDALADDADFFVEHVQITAIVFDNTNDVTVWATTYFDEELHFFHLGLQFQYLDLLLRLAGSRAEALQEEVAEALATVTEWPCLLEYTSEEEPPVPLDGVSLKLSCTYPADTDEDDEDAVPHNIFYLEGVYLRIEP